jgi:hypothetical protein
MTTTKFTDAVEIEGSQDTTQLKIQDHTSQTEPLQSWEDRSGNTLSRITGDSRLQVGDDLGMEIPDALIEAYRDLSSTTAPQPHPALVCPALPTPSGVSIGIITTIAVCTFMTRNMRI